MQIQRCVKALFILTILSTTVNNKSQEKYCDCFSCSMTNFLAFLKILGGRDAPSRPHKLITVQIVPSEILAVEEIISVYQLDVVVPFVAECRIICVHVRNRPFPAKGHVIENATLESKHSSDLTKTMEFYCVLIRSSQLVFPYSNRCLTFQVRFGVDLTTIYPISHFLLLFS